jgi:Mg-chelatase subunit ChlD
MTDSRSPDERARRWRLVLGASAQSSGYGSLGGEDAARDSALAALYNTHDGPPDGARRAPQGRAGGLGGSAPAVARWLGDIRRYFPTSVVRVLQSDAMERLGLRRLLVEPELLEAVAPDVSLVATLLGLRTVIPEPSRQSARAVVRTVTDQLERRLAHTTRVTVRGALDRAARTRRPRRADIDWGRTIHANLRHYQPAYHTVIPERLVGYGRSQSSMQRDLILAVDQSGSMAASVVYASVFGAVLAGLRALRTRLVVFDTTVVDLTAQLADPVDVLFATQLGGGTDIDQAVAYCATLIERPDDTILVLLSDLFEGGQRDDAVQRLAALVRAGVSVVVLLALNDDGAPAYDHHMATALAGVGVAAFACTPDQFPDLMAAAIQRQDLARWAADNGIATAAPVGVGPL